jgi:hypothetical protein
MKPIDISILLACECSGVIREALRARGFNAISCDLKEAEDNSPHHIQGDVLGVLGYHSPGNLGTDGWRTDRRWHAMIAHPECRYMSVSGLHWNGRVPGRAQKTAEAIAFAKKLWEAPIEHIAIENPVSCLWAALGTKAHYIQPHQFGADASKATGFALKGFPPLVPTEHIAPRMVNGKPRWSNQTDSGQNRLGPSPTRSADRARTYPGIAAAIAQQWGDYLLEVYK